MSFPILDFAGGRVVPFAERHLSERYVAWLNDPQVVRYSEQRHHRHTLATCRAYFESFRGSANHFLAIEADATSLGHIGNIGVAIDPMNRLADVSIMVGERRAWRTGLASCAWSAVVTELLAGQSILKVTAGTMSVNESMLRLMSRSGMQIEATHPRHFLFEGQAVDMICAAKFAAAK